MNKNVNAIRMLSIEMIEKANSGHPGICMGAAPMMYSLFANKMNISATESNWFNRDRFVLAAGHGSAMLYSTLHLAGYDVAMDDLKEFRQLNSLTPGHPEVGHTDGIDATSGPLGQGVAQAVGLAMAEAHLGAKFNKEDISIVDHYTYALCGDGDLQEGVSAEASSLAGHLKLNKLIMLWDSNDIQLDDSTDKAISEDILKRYESYGWNTIKVVDGMDTAKIDAAIEEAKKSDKPTLIEVKTTIGFGSPNKGGKSDSHGAPLGRDEIELVKSEYNWDLEAFQISEDIYSEFRKNTITKGDELILDYAKVLDSYSTKYPEDYKKLEQSILGDFNLVKEELELGLSEASRVSSGKAINHFNAQLPNLIGGSADLSKSNNTTISGTGIFGVEGYSEQNISFGVREFAMASTTNGMLLHGGLKTFCATFFVFSDYLKPAIRMSAIQNLPNIYVMTHDSVAVGEDGPTHEPIEQLSGLRAIPNVNVIRPCDANETQEAWKIALESKTTPTVLVLTRQNLEVITKMNDNVSKGAYILSEDEGFTKTIVASGSEVKLAMDVKEELNKEGIKVKVISMPSLNIFEKQSQEYKDQVFNNCNREESYFIEMANCIEGYKYAANVIGISTFGMSAPGDQVIDYFGFNKESISNKIMKK